MKGEGKHQEEKNNSEEKQSRLFSARVGAAVVRNIEGIWFPAVVESIDARRQTCTIKYLDDDNVETVLIEELRGAEEKPSSRDGHRGNDTVRNPLPRPLAGLVEDDYEQRNSHRPTVTVHTDTNTEEGIIINGAESTLAVGGGLRALRYLKS